MDYKGTVVTDVLDVTEIYTVLKVDFSKVPNEGERHPFPEIVRVTEGELIQCVGEREYVLRQGQMMIYAPNAYHIKSDRSPKKALADILSFNAVSQILPQLYGRVITLTDAQARLFTDIVEVGCKSLCSRNEGESRGMRPTERTEEHTPWKLKKQLEFFLTELYGSSEKPKPARDRRKLEQDMEFRLAEAYLRAHLTEPLTLAELAAGCSMSVTKLKTLFRNNTGGGPIDYRIRLRIEEAKRLIDAGEMNFSQITDKLGFSSLHYFSRVFKRITGVSPSRYALRAENKA